MTTTLSIALAGGEPPSEFRIFTAGIVDTSKGRFVFDEAAASSVLAAWKTQGNDLMVDYDHASLASSPLDPAQSGKAAGWFGLELRNNGELWAVNVRWTEPAATALRAKEWRYMSPAFETQDDRITSLWNVALTNIPATRRLPPLMAASMGACMDPELVQKALDALTSGDAEAAAEILKSLIASAASGGAAPAAPADPAAASADPNAPAPAGDENKDEVAAASAKLMRLSGRETFTAAVAEVEIWRASHLELESERQKLAKEREIFEAAERRELCKRLVVEAGKAPASVWASDKADAPKKYLAAMPLADLREMVADEIRAKGGKVAASVKAPAGDVGDGSKTFVTKHGAVTLSARELATCADVGAKPEVYAENKALRSKASGPKG